MKNALLWRPKLGLDGQMHKPSVTTADKNEPWVGRRGGVGVGDEGGRSPLK